MAETLTGAELSVFMTRNIVSGNPKMVYFDWSTKPHPNILTSYGGSKFGGLEDARVKKRVNITAFSALFDREVIYWS